MLTSWKRSLDEGRAYYIVVSGELGDGARKREVKAILTEVLESKLTDDDARWRLETIRSQISRISKIIQTLLNMARPHKARRVGQIKLHLRRAR